MTDDIARRTEREAYTYRAQGYRAKFTTRLAFASILWSDSQQAPKLSINVKSKPSTDKPHVDNPSISTVIPVRSRGL